MKTAQHIHQTYLVSLLTTPKVFADETEKYRFLNRLPQMLERQRCTLTAFTLLDDAFHAILCFEEDPVHPDAVIDDYFRQAFLPYYQGKYGYRENIRSSAAAVRLQAPEEVLRQTLAIHVLALYRGLVRNIGDYFWCSAQVYKNLYLWKCVDPDLLLRALSPDRWKALRMLNQSQRKLLSSPAQMREVCSVFAFGP